MFSTVRIPDLPFENRSAELSAIRGFLEASEPPALLIEGQGGIGKSRLLEAAFAASSDRVHLLLIDCGDDDAGVDDQILSGVAKIRTRHSWIRGAVRAASELPDQVREILPKVAAGSPILGDAAAHATEKVVGRSPTAARSARLARRFRRALSELERLSPNDTVVIAIDDLHWLHEEGEQTVSDFISLAQQAAKPRFRFVISSRPLTNPDSVMSRLLSTLAMHGLLASMRITPLADVDLQRVAAHVVSNPHQFEGVVRLSEGNPQRFLECLIKMNVRGHLSAKGQMISLSEGTNLAYLTEDLWDLLDQDGTARRLLGVLAASGGFSISSREVLAESLGLQSRGQLDAALLQLADKQIVHADKGSGAMVVRFRHDTIRAHVQSRLANACRLEFRICNEIAASYWRAHLTELHEAMVAEVRSNEWTSGGRRAAEEHVTELAQLAENEREAEIAGWQSLALGVARLADSLGHLDLVVRLATPLLSAVGRLLDPSASVVDELKAFLARAHYQLGNYDDCVAVAKSIAHPSAEVSYCHAIAHLIRKIGPDPAGVARIAVNRHRGDDSDFEPLLKSVEAMALQETDRNTEAIDCYESYLASGDYRPAKSVTWMQFQMMSPLFVDADRAYELCTEALDVFLESGEDRSAGMACHNMGYCLLRLREYGEAMVQFHRALELLSRSSPHETVFPLTNRAFVWILKGEFEKALDSLISCVFRRMPPHQQTYVLINMALARWGAGMDGAAALLDRVPDVPGIRDHDWVVWQVEYARCFLVLNANSADGPTQESLDACRARLMSVASVASAAPYWNALEADVVQRFKLRPGRPMAEKSAAGAGSQTTDPTVSLIRPATFCFGHA